VVEGRAHLPGEIANGLEKAGCTVLVGGPVHYRALRNTDLSAPRLRLACSSGAMLDPADAVRFTQKTGIGVTEVYGSTETGGVATRCRADGERNWTTFDGVRWKLRDGRLWVASPFGSPDLDLDEEGFGPTGDRAEPTPDGRFILKGRADGIVKIGGSRVDLLEVEQKIAVMAGIDDACVLAEPVEDGRSVQLAAMVVSRFSTGELKELFARDLEPLARPRRIIKVDRIPTHETGKRDRKAVEKLLGINS
jgi:acyl-coenzyme A synthetase/AMP-(fatty) acid ligase